MPQERPRRRSRITGDGQGPDPLTYPVTDARTDASYNTDDYVDEGLDDYRPPTSAIRFDNPSTQSRITGSSSQGVPVQPRRQTGTREFPRQRALPPQTPLDPARSASNKRTHWLLPLGVGMVAMLVLWILGSTVLAWGLQRYNDVLYGNPRTFQTNAAVGHNDSKAHPSHFIAMNWNHQAVVIEFMGGDPSKTVNYVAPVYIAEDDTNPAPVTVEFRDLNGDGKPDMIVHIHLPSQDQVSVFINDGGKFRPSNGTDKIHLP